MRSILRYSFYLGSCLLILSCGGKKESDWYTLKSGEGGFTVNMPSKPVKSDKTEVTAFGRQAVHFYTWKPGTFSIAKFKLFQISYTDCAPRLVSDSVMMELMLDSAINMRKKDFTEKEIVSQHIELNGYPGTAFIYQVPNDNTIAIVKECITNGRKYDLTVICKRDQATNEEINQFFNSFQVLR